MSAKFKAATVRQPGGKRAAFSCPLKGIAKAYRSKSTRIGTTFHGMIVELKRGEEMTFKLLALDLDETLLDANSQISAENQAAIRRAVDKGILVTIATGRMFRSALSYARQLKIDLPLITYHGALIRTVSGKDLFYRPVPLIEAREIIDIVQAQNLHINVYVHDQLFVAEENRYTDAYRKFAKVPLKVVGDLQSFLIEPPTKLSIIGDNKQLVEIQKELWQRYGDKLEIAFSLPQYLEITDKEATKGKALAFLAKMHKIPRQQVAAIGDSYNDISMLEYAGIGVAVANACADVKAAADIITESNVNHGVAVFINQFLDKEDSRR